MVSHKEDHVQEKAKFLEQKKSPNVYHHSLPVHVGKFVIIKQRKDKRGVELINEETRLSGG